MASMTYSNNIIDTYDNLNTSIPRDLNILITFFFKIEMLVNKKKIEDILMRKKTYQLFDICIINLMLAILRRTLYIGDFK